MIRNGRGLMPPYNTIEEMDRWDVVNYLRALQGVNGKTVVVGPLAAPGVTGDKLPGATRMGPTKPAPFYNPRSVLTGTQGRGLGGGGGAAMNQPATQGLATGAPTDTAPRSRTDSVKARIDSLRARVIR